MMTTRYTLHCKPLDFEALAYRPRDYVEAQLLLAALYGDIMCAYGETSGWTGRAWLGVMGPSDLTANDPFVRTGLLDLELESPTGSVVGVAWVEVDAYGHLVYRHAFRAPSARSGDQGWTEPTDFLGTTDLGRRLRDWLA